MTIIYFTSDQWEAKLYNAENLYRNSVIDISKAARDVMASEPKIIRRCDPKNYSEGKFIIDPTNSY